MKKTLLALSALMMLGLAACDPDDDKPITPGGETPDNPSGSYSYSPALKISQIKDSGQVIEQWSWNGNRLDRVVSESEEGSDTATFGYTGYVLTSINTTDGTEAILNYQDGLLNKVTLTSPTSLGTPVTADITLAYNGTKVSNIQMPIPEELFNSLMGNDDIPESFKQAKGSKNNSGALNIDFLWSGNNVTTTNMTATLSYDINGADLMEMASMFGLDQLAENIPAAALAILANVNFPTEMTVTIVNNSTYDEMINPLCGYMGALVDMNDLDNLELGSIFSANNVLTSASSTTMNYSITIPAEVMLALQLAGFNLSSYGITSPISGSVPMDEETVTYTYQYNNEGFPTLINNTYEYIYAQ